MRGGGGGLFPIKIDKTAGGAIASFSLNIFD
jgi:hypothetical protein